MNLLRPTAAVALIQQSSAASTHPISHPSYRSQQGVALLTVLLMVVSITIVAGSMLASQRLHLRQTELLLRQDQALMMAQAGESFAIALLQADSKINQFDSAEDTWRQQLPPYPVGNAIIQVVINDESGKFNINTLYHDGQVDKAAMDYFSRLLTQIGLDGNIANAILDWQDPDDDMAGKGGAERDYYLSQANNRHRAANQDFVSIETLGQIYGLNAKAKAKLMPLVSVAPAVTKININSASDDVLAALAPSLNASSITTLTQRIKDGDPYQTTAEFLQQPTIKALPQAEQQAIQALIDVKSSHVSLQIQVSLEERTRYLTSQLLRQDNNVVIYQRQLRPFELLPSQDL